jgi:hypothetical protein
LSKTNAEMIWLVVTGLLRDRKELLAARRIPPLVPMVVRKTKVLSKSAPRTFLTI